MARIIKSIEIQGKPANARFDTGATNTYVRSALVADAPRQAMVTPAHVGLGGETIESRELCLIQGKIEGLDFLADAVPVSKLGRERDWGGFALRRAISRRLVPTRAG